MQSALSFFVDVVNGASGLTLFGAPFIPTILSAVFGLLTAWFLLSMFLGGRR